MEEKELWMNKLKEKLEDYSEPIPASGWEQLEKELMPPVERKIYPYRKWMMAAGVPRKYRLTEETKASNITAAAAIIPVSYTHLMGR